MRGRYQGGSLAGFIIIGVVLALVLIGGLYGLNRYNSEQSKEVIAEDSSNTGKKQNDNSKNEKSSNEPTPVKDSSPKQPSDEATNKEAEDTSSKDDSSEDSSSSKPAEDTQLPVTGPTETIAATIAVLALSFAVTHYVQSRSLRNR